MLKLFTVSALLLLSLVSSLPTIAPRTTQSPKDRLCNRCTQLINAFITGDKFMDNDNNQVFKNIFKQICDTVVSDGPMTAVCVAGIYGEIDYLHDKFNGNPQAICDILGCPAK
ncbi:hypothetical protein PENTCL1PPCAC_23316 [Pristionchus entomophagus]|uniref:Saposin B-type domain-containing protein n=1 Tax=Pristionchus entomophagus TaxID=358040 RepID=A0AAV5U3S3_9BILA|nr:hypothetical protein PENTCL1PPCAC_23316 [Pristionchus entomophagus]